MDQPIQVGVTPRAKLEEQIAELQKLIQQMGGLNAISEEAGNVFKRAMEGGRQATDWLFQKYTELKRSIKDSTKLQEAFANLKDPSTAEAIALLSEGLAGLAAISRNAFAAVGKELKEFSDSAAGTDIKMALGLDLSLFADQLDAASKYATDPRNAVSFGLFLGTDKLERQLTAAAKIVDEGFYDKLLHFDRKAAESMGVLANQMGSLASNSSSAAQSATLSLQGLRGVFKTQLIDASLEFGTSLEDNATAMKELAAQVPNIDIIQRLNIRDGTKAVSGLSAALAIAKATGLGMSDVGDIIGQMTRSLDVKPEDIGQRFELLTRAAADTGVSTKEMVDLVKDASKEMRFFGDNTEAAAAEFNVFARALGPGRLENAKELFGTMVSRISQMKDGTKAFLGMTTGLGGGGDALESKLRVEEAVASGQGLDKIREEMTAKIEELSGAPILTRKEALDTGQATQFEIQQRLIEQFFGASRETGQAAQLAEVLRSRDQGTLQAFRAQLTDRGGQMVGQARERVAVDSNPLQMAANRLGAVGLQLTQSAANGLALSDNLVSTTQTIAASQRQQFGGAEGGGVIGRVRDWMAGVQDFTTAGLEGLRAAEEAAKRQAPAMETKTSLTGTAETGRGGMGAGVATSMERVVETGGGGAGVGAATSISRVAETGDRGVAVETGVAQVSRTGEQGVQNMISLAIRTGEVVGKPIATAVDALAKNLSAQLAKPIPVEVKVTATPELMKLLNVEGMVRQEIKKNDNAATGLK
jgi:hypothetical protein